MGDADAVAREVLRLLGEEPERRRLAAIGVDGVPRHFSADRIIDSYVGLIAAVVAARRGRGR